MVSFLGFSKVYGFKPVLTFRIETSLEHFLQSVCVKMTNFARQIQSIGVLLALLGLGAVKRNPFFAESSPTWLNQLQALRNFF